TSLAGRTKKPLALPGKVRVGGFGGVEGLIQYLTDSEIHCLIDATHPFAAQMSWHAYEATTAIDLPLLRIERPAWLPQKGDRWIEVPTLAAAADQLPSTAKRVFLTIGRQQLAPFAPLSQFWFLMRSIDSPQADLPLPPGEILLARGPFSVEQERTLLLDYQIDVVVSKNSGGPDTYAKVEAARALHIPIVMVQRPVMPPGDAVPDATTAVQWLMQHL
ncbi:MAG TPA: cobalt-precorrin-6A reductase, partial [Stenomitos sp.]